MANFAYTVLGVTQTTLVDAVNDLKFGKPQALSFTTNPSNPTINNSVASPAELSIFNDTLPGWMTGRRPETGQLYPRGVFNK